MRKVKGGNEQNPVELPPWLVVPFDPLNDPDEPDVLDELFDPGVLESAAIHLDLSASRLQICRSSESSIRKSKGSGHLEKYAFPLPPCHKHLP